MKNLSRDQLLKSSERRIKHLMINVLERFEKVFPSIDNSREGQIFKSDLRNAFNDVMRAQRDELNDYEIDYRPLKIQSDNTLALTRTFMNTVQKIDFGFTPIGTPFLTIFADPSNLNVLSAIREEFETGVVLAEGRLDIYGLMSCINKILPVMDKYKLHPQVKEKYREWRKEVVKQYRS